MENAEMKQIVEMFSELRKENLQQFSELRDDLSGVKNDLSGVKNDLSGVKNDLSGVKNDLSGVKNDLSGVKNDLSGIKLTVEQEIEPNIQFLAEGQKTLIDQVGRLQDLPDRVEKLEEKVDVLTQTVKENVKDIAGLKILRPAKEL